MIALTPASWPGAVAAPAARHIALVGCGKKKLANAAPARELYTGPLFRAALAVAVAEFGEDVWVLSAQHGLVDLDEMTAPYDLAMEDVPAAARLTWAEGVLRNLVDEDHGTPAHLTVYAGAPYVSALEQMLPPHWTLEDPLYALSQGERLAWLKSRLQQLRSSTPSNASAVPSGAAPKESAVSVPTATRLTQEQRQESFVIALGMEDGIAKLCALREQMLQGLARQEERMRADYKRHWHAAITGEDPDSRPQQQTLLDERTVPAAPAPAKEEPREPEPPAGGKRLRRRTTTEAKGTKRAPEATAARTATVAESASVENDAVPAPQVPCCTCGESLSEHMSPQGEVGACRATKCGAKPRCKSFQLGRVHGWTLSWYDGSRWTKHKPVFLLAIPDAPEVKVGPLFVDQGTLLYSDPEHPEFVTDALERARRTGSWSEGEGTPSVSLRVLEAIAAVLLPPEAEALDAPLEPTAPQPSLGDTAPASVGLDPITQEEVSDLRQALKHLNGKKSETALGIRLRRVLSVLALSAREESWCHLLESDGWRVHLHAGEVWLSFGAQALETSGPWCWDGKVLVRCAGWVASKLAKSPDVMTALEVQLRLTLERQDASDWRVELPASSTSHSIIHLWLVNDSTGERKAASWWSLSGLKPSHHLAGKLEGEALSAHLALNGWWATHPEVVQDMETACREGRVPGLRVGEPPEPLQDGPFFYALSDGWRLAAWDDGEEPTAFFIEPGGEQLGTFQWRDGALVGLTVSSAVWANANMGRLKEAEDFIRRGFITEFRRVAGGAT